MKYTKSEETELVARVKNGDTQAFTLLFYSYKDKLSGFLLNLTGSADESKDIVQDVFMKIWQDRENIDKIKNFNAYIFKSAQNRMIDNLRKFSRERFSLTDLDDANIMEENTEKPDEIFFEKEKRLIFQDAVNKLSAQQKKIYQYHREQGKLLKDIAQEMNLSLSTVQNHMNKAIKNIREYIVKNFR
ncbi:MAG: RNA polymerase sigma-70 factor [Prevotellaceae bacterium]|jgi:RNA polymerase sigma-70 factor (ECF subfamily)|nr:RNA polymerase sigma-70 factor [Prevotellaceae bacterium]